VEREVLDFLHVIISDHHAATKQQHLKNTKKQKKKEVIPCKIKVFSFRSPK